MDTVDQNITSITSRLGIGRGRQNISGTERPEGCCAAEDGQDSDGGASDGQEHKHDQSRTPDAHHPYDHAEANALVKAGQEIERFFRIKDPNTRLRIDRDEDSSRLVYQMVDRESGDVVKQFQPRDLLRYLKSFREIEGLVVDGKS